MIMICKIYVQYTSVMLNLTISYVYALIRKHGIKYVLIKLTFVIITYHSVTKPLDYCMLSHYKTIDIAFALPLPVFLLSKDYVTR